MSETSTLEERLAYLEEQNEGMKRVGLLLVILVIVMGATMIFQNNSASRAVATDGLILNNGGKPRSALTAMPNGHLGMVFYDFKGEVPPAEFNKIPYLDGLVIYDQTGQPRILIGMDDKDQPILAVVDKEGKTLFSALPLPASSQPPTGPEGTATPAPGATPGALPSPVTTPAK